MTSTPAGRWRVAGRPARTGRQSGVQRAGNADERITAHRRAPLCQRGAEPGAELGSPRGLWARRPVGITISPLDRQRTRKQQLTVQTQETEQKPPQTPVRTRIRVCSPRPAPPESPAAEAGVRGSGGRDGGWVDRWQPPRAGGHCPPQPSPAESAGPPHFQNTRRCFLPSQLWQWGRGAARPEISGEEATLPFPVRAPQTRPSSPSQSP